ncbi:MAG: hypothetical protein COA99_14840 [Moraxellaceae bacterium]|nr:MAG: hypothetical protein COA99_14840 [Moraxellaceae bacterium]
MREIITLLYSTLFMAICFNSYAQEDMVSYTLNANEPITGCKIVAIKDSDDLGKIESIVGSYLNLKIHRDNVYKITINEEKVYYLQYEDRTGFAQVDGVKITGPDALASLAVSSDEAAKSDPGIKYRVQIGAFTNDISIYAFKNLGPLYTEKIDGGVTRYMIGSFTSHDEAAKVEATIRNLGYTNAFAVVCYNGKRVSFHEAEEWSAQNIR